MTFTPDCLKPAEAVNPSAFSMSFTTDGLDRRLLPVLVCTAEWKDQPRLPPFGSTPPLTRSSSPNNQRPQARAEIDEVRSVSRSRASREASKTRTSSISRFFHTHHADKGKTREPIQIVAAEQEVTARSRAASPRRTSQREESVSRAGSRRPSNESSSGDSFGSTSGVGSENLDTFDSRGSSAAYSTGPSTASSSADSVASTSTDTRRHTTEASAATPQRPPITRQSQKAPARPILGTSPSYLLRRTQSAEDVRSPAPIDESSTDAARDERESFPPQWWFEAKNPIAEKSANTFPNQVAGRTRRPSVSQAQLRRPRSLHGLSTSPPLYDDIPYPPTSVHYHSQPIAPRPDEGHESLPEYFCDVHLEGYFPRKVEYSAPNVISRDRAWKRQYIIIRGTSIKVYKYDLRTHPVEGEDEWSTADPSMTKEPLHCHLGEYPSATPSALPHSIGDARDRLGRHNTLIRSYSLQNAECGVATDYYSRDFTVRIRAEGEQFLLQAVDQRGVVDLIETLQAATNVALDLDSRALPVLITMPRRRRRVGAPNVTVDASGGSVGETSPQPPVQYPAPPRPHPTGF
ncbi:hypothetical protein P7C70_g4766, partial [Phenoliferia sp. Uapishka_3]